MQNVRKTVVLCLGLFLSVCLPAHADIYEDLWAIDQLGNGLSAEILTPGAPAKKDIQVHPQTSFSSKKGYKDAAPKPYFAEVSPDKLEGETYQTLEALFDNYNLNPRDGEDLLGSKPEEDKEIEAFLDAISKTFVFEETLKFINQKNLAGRKLTEAAFKADIKKIWFEPYDNFFRPSGKSNGKASPDCTGFEHVFVGEASGDSIGGYHNWYKFYLEEQAGNVNYLGYAEGIPGAETVPEVATFAMSWDTDEGRLNKPVTGFLVGNSPELQIAWGTLAFYQTSKVSQFEDINLIVSIENAIVSLVLYREVLEKAIDDKPVRGDQIRTFYPKLISLNSYKE
jgi:poly(U)-specific endoribonuclease